MYAIVCTRPDILCVFYVISRYMKNSEKKHWEVVKWVLHYMRGAIDTDILYQMSMGAVEVKFYVGGGPIS